MSDKVFVNFANSASFSSNSDINVANTRIANNKENTVRYEKEIEEAKQKLESLKEEIEQKKQKKENLKENKIKYQTELEEKESLLTNQKFRQRLAENAVVTMRTLWSPNNAAQQFLQLVQAINNHDISSVAKNGPCSQAERI